MDQVGDGAVVADPAAVEHDHALASGRDVLGLVGGQHHDRRPRELREHGPQGDPLFRVDSGGRLVEDKDGWRAEQRLGQRDPPALAAGHGPQPLGAEAVEPHQAEDAAHLRVPRGRTRVHSLSSAM